MTFSDFVDHIIVLQYVMVCSKELGSNGNDVKASAATTNKEEELGGGGGVGRRRMRKRKRN